jgi:SAM-dependent methyltransferase
MSDTADYALHYGEYHRTDAAYFDEWFAHNRSFLEPLIADIRERPILDIGCGFGLLVHALRRLGCRAACGIDISRGQIRVAQNRGLPCELVDETAQSAWFDAHPQHFAAIFLFDVLEHIAPVRQIAFLAMLGRALAPGGRLLLQVPNASSPIAAHMRYIDHTHTSAFTVDSLRFVLAGAGLRAASITDAHDEMSAGWSAGAGAGAGSVLRLLRWSVGRTIRLVWRLTYLSEFGRPGLRVPLGRNLLAIAVVAPEHPEPKTAPPRPTEAELAAP